MNEETPQTSEREQDASTTHSASSSSTTSSSSSDSSSASSSPSQDHSSCLQVCRGPDCSRGGGSAVLELEELCQEYQHQHDRQGNNNNSIHTEQTDLLLGLPIQHVGCRNFCAVGPNVYYRNQDQHFQRVSSPQDCADVVQQVIELHYEMDKNEQQQQQHADSSISKPTSSSTTTLSRMLFKAADRVRWEWMRQAQHHLVPSTSGGSGRGKATMKATSTATNKNPTRARLQAELLDTVHAAELRAARSLRAGIVQDEHVERAKRRYQRLSQLLLAHSGSIRS